MIISIMIDKLEEVGDLPILQLVIHSPLSAYIESNYPFPIKNPLGIYGVPKFQSRLD